MSLFLSESVQGGQPYLYTYIIFREICTNMVVPLAHHCTNFRKIIEKTGNV